MVKHCLKNGADPNYIKPGASPLLNIATEQNSIMIVNCLLHTHKADVNIMSSIGETPLICACNFYKRRIFYLLLLFDADINIADLAGKTPLLLACTRQAFDLVYILLEHNVNLNVEDCFGNTPLSLVALESANIYIMELLLTKGAVIEKTATQFHLFFELILNAHVRDNIQTILFLLKWGVDINLIDEITGRNCLHYVAITGYLELAKLLCRKGASTQIVDKSNRTPIDIARDHKNFAVYDYLESKYHRKSRVSIITIYEPLDDPLVDTPYLV